MTKTAQYDLEERTFCFARDVRIFIKGLNRTIGNIEDAKQLIRSSGSVAANYVEANEALSKKDFLMRVKICKKEAKETRLWLRLINYDSKENKRLLKETEELMKIFGSIVTKIQK